ncbi:hypothetical protein GCM10022223_38840 [Kineosporia mesophila]|uniref:Uncharacterized protein n=1 Tax=Kineosporia mesophila TaxID=566012 RepID=A0ABP6ZTA6_9ACTN|nr:hypothetical protein [Kineosporia mesophila]MCD5348510.1 hypothetical protein [Kineosporia mesophila]
MIDVDVLSTAAGLQEFDAATVAAYCQTDEARVLIVLDEHGDLFTKRIPRHQAHPASPRYRVLHPDALAHRITSVSSPVLPPSLDLTDPALDDFGDQPPSPRPPQPTVTAPPQEPRPQASPPPEPLPPEEPLPAEPTRSRPRPPRSTPRARRPERGDQAHNRPAPSGFTSGGYTSGGYTSSGTSAPRPALDRRQAPGRNPAPGKNPAQHENSTPAMNLRTEPDLPTGETPLPEGTSATSDKPDQARASGKARPTGASPRTRQSRSSADRAPWQPPAPTSADDPRNDAPRTPGSGQTFRSDAEASAFQRDSLPSPISSPSPEAPAPFPPAAPSPSRSAPPRSAPSRSVHSHVASPEPARPPSFPPHVPPHPFPETRRSGSGPQDPLSPDTYPPDLSLSGPPAQDRAWDSPAPDAPPSLPFAPPPQAPFHAASFPQISLSPTPATRSPRSDPPSDPSLRRARTPRARPPQPGSAGPAPRPSHSAPSSRASQINRGPWATRASQPTRQPPTAPGEPGASGAPIVRSIHSGHEGLDRLEVIHSRDPEPEPDPRIATAENSLLACAREDDPEARHALASAAMSHLGECVPSIPRDGALHTAALPPRLRFALTLATLTLIESTGQPIARKLLISAYDDATALAQEFLPSRQADLISRFRALASGRSADLPLA